VVEVRSATARALTFTCTHHYARGSHTTHRTCLSPTGRAQVVELPSAGRLQQ